MKGGASGGHRGRGAKPLADLVAAILDPVLQRKAGMTTALIAAWPEIAGPRLDAVSLPEKLVWPQRHGEDDPFQPATLVIACEATAALRLQHQTGEILGRVNVFFGYLAVARIRIVQKALTRRRPSRKPRLGKVDPAAEKLMGEILHNIEDPKLREALDSFARSVLERNAGRSVD